MFGATEAIFASILILAVPFIGSLLSLSLSVIKEKEVDKAIYLSLPYVIYLVISLWLFRDVISDDNYIGTGVEPTILEKVKIFFGYYQYIAFFVSLFLSPIIAMISFWFAYKNKENWLWWFASGGFSLVSLLFLFLGIFYIDAIVRPLLLIWFVGKKIIAKLKERL